ncbi:hypothetical protein CKO23_14205 [Thiocystis violacea]|nr:hypothetical protein [Thiocystis violacea]
MTRATVWCDPVTASALGRMKPQDLTALVAGADSQLLSGNALDEARAEIERLKRNLSVLSERIADLPREPGPSGFRDPALEAEFEEYLKEQTMQNTLTDRDRRILEAKRAGLSVRTIATRTGAPEPAVVEALNRLRSTARELRDDGQTPAGIALEMGITEADVSAVLKWRVVKLG